jgi:hypothetical protein
METDHSPALHHVSWERYMADREKEAAALREVRQRCRRITGGEEVASEREGKETAIGQVDRRL